MRRRRGLALGGGVVSAGCCVLTALFAERLLCCPPCHRPLPFPQVMTMCGAPASSGRCWAPLGPGQARQPLPCPGEPDREQAMKVSTGYGRRMTEKLFLLLHIISSETFQTQQRTARSPVAPGRPSLAGPFPCPGRSSALGEGEDRPVEDHQVKQDSFLQASFSTNRKP